MKIIIDDATEDCFKMEEDEKQLDLYPWIVLNLDEIGFDIAYNLFDAEYQLTQAILDDEINDFLSDIHERIIEKAIQSLEENGVDVL